MKEPLIVTDKEFLKQIDNAMVNDVYFPCDEVQ